MTLRGYIRALSLSLSLSLSLLFRGRGGERGGVRGEGAVVILMAKSDTRTAERSRAVLLTVAILVSMKSNPSCAVTGSNCSIFFTDPREQNEIVFLCCTRALPVVA